jgi:hypothetical protein
MNRADLRLRIRQQADMVGSLFVDDTTELNPWIDTATADLYDFLVSKFGDSKFARSAWLNVRHDWAEAATLGTVPTDPRTAWPTNVQAYNLTSGDIALQSPQAVPANGIASGYILPFDFSRLVRIQFVPGYVTQAIDIVPPDVLTAPIWRLIRTGSQSEMVPMRPMDISGMTMDLTPRSWTQTEPLYHLAHGPHRFASGTEAAMTMQWIQSTIVQFLPLPTERYAVQVLYVPKVRTLDGDTEEFGYDFPEWVILDCAAQCLEKQQQDSKPLRVRLETLKNRIQNEARTNDAANPKMVSMYRGHHSQIGSRRTTGPWPR